MQYWCLPGEVIMTGKQKFFANIGDKFGRITVIEVISSERIRVKCDCGNEKIINKYNFYRAKHPTRSCGCLFKDCLIARNNAKKGIATKKHGHSAITVIHKGYRQGAKSRDIEFHLTRDKLEELVLLPCFYCGQKDSMVTKTDTYDYYHNGIDRIDSNLGYIDKNMVPCCSMCNRAKYTHTAKEFIDMCKRVAALHLEYDDNVEGVQQLSCTAGTCEI